jgi:hypothetical protein
MTITTMATIDVVVGPSTTMAIASVLDPPKPPSSRKPLLGPQHIHHLCHCSAFLGTGFCKQPRHAGWPLSSSPPQLCVFAEANTCTTISIACVATFSHGASIVVASRRCGGDNIGGGLEGRGRCSSVYDRVQDKWGKTITSGKRKVDMNLNRDIYVLI